MGLKKTQAPIPIKSIGIIGASQLSLYLTQAARNCGYTVLGLSDKKNDPAVSWFNRWIKGKSSKTESLNKFSKATSIILFENKANLSTKTSQQLQVSNKKFFPQLETLHKTNDLWTLKELLYDYEIPQVPYFKINGKDDLDQGFHFFNRKVVIKNRFPVKGKADTFIIDSLQKLNTFKNTNKGKETHFIIEKFLNYKSEHRIVMARNKKNQFSVYPLLTLDQIGSDYSQVYTAAHEPSDFKSIVKKLKALLTAIDYAGVITFTLFNDQNKLYVDEADCRPCNTGMITLDGFNINQFELHIRAIINLDLPAIKQYTKKLVCKYLIAGRRDQVQINKTMNERFLNQSLSRYPNGKLYWYGKKEKRAHRKLGHINYTR